MMDKVSERKRKLRGRALCANWMFSKGKQTKDLKQYPTNTIKLAPNWSKFRLIRTFFKKQHSIFGQKFLKKTLVL